MSVMHLLGQWQVLQPGDMLKWLACVAVLLSIYVLGLTARKLSNDLKKSPAEIDVEKFREELRGMAPSEKVDVLIEKISTAATKEEVEQLRISLKGYVDQAQMDRRMSEVKELLARVEKDMTQQIKELRSYLHDDVHAFRNQAQTVWASAELQREGMQSRMNVFSETLFEIRGWIRAQRGESAQ